MPDAITQFYLEQLPGSKQNNAILQASCPLCHQSNADSPGTIVVFLNNDSYFHGYFRCLNRCTPGGFPLHFARSLNIHLEAVPGYDIDREYPGNLVDFPSKNINKDILDYTEKVTDDQHSYFTDHGIEADVIKELQVGYNGRYLVFPYIQNDGNCYSAHCIHPERQEDTFWHGNEHFTQGSFRIFNRKEIFHCENGSLIIVEGEENALTIKGLGLPAVAIPGAGDLAEIDPDDFRWIKTLFLLVNNTSESIAQAKTFATKTGFKVRLISWPEGSKSDLCLTSMAQTRGKNFQADVFSMIKMARAFSPFSSPVREYQLFNERVQLESGPEYLKVTSGFPLLDKALGGLHGINIVGGTPKAGKSCFFIQIAADMALRKLPVLYYDFENGKQKILFRTLCRLSHLSGEQIRRGNLNKEEQQRLTASKQQIQKMLPWFRVVNDRKLTPELMRRHIDFLRHETSSDYTVVIIDSLHKLPFKDLSERRTGIDGWLRQLEAIRDEMQVSFLVISELTRGTDGQFDQHPQLGSFKGSGDIGYSADNAMVLMPSWDPFDNNPPETRNNALWLVASREMSPGKIASYRLDYPYWGFIEEG